MLLADTDYTRLNENTNNQNQSKNKKWMIGSMMITFIYQSCMLLGIGMLWGSNTDIEIQGFNLFTLLVSYYFGSVFLFIVQILSLFSTKWKRLVIYQLTVSIMALLLFPIVTFPIPSHCLVFYLISAIYFIFLVGYSVVWISCA